MDAKRFLLDRLTNSRPDWTVWDELLNLVSKLEFEFIHEEYMGDYVASGSRLSFGIPKSPLPEWLPGYVAALHKMKAAHFEYAGGFADAMNPEPVKKGFLMNPITGDKSLGYPVIETEPDTFHFQTNQFGKFFFINPRLDVLYFNIDDQCLTVLDTLEQFTKTNIEQAIANKNWFDRYSGKPGMD